MLFLPFPLVFLRAVCVCRITELVFLQWFYFAYIFLSISQWTNKEGTYNAFYPPPFKQYLCERFWAYWKIKLVLPLSAAGDPFYVIVSSNTCWRNPPAWFWCSMFCSKFTLTEVYSCCAFINMVLPDLQLESKTTFYLERYNRQNPADPLKRRKHVVGISGDYFLVTVQLDHLIGLDPKQHFSGQQKHSSKAINITVLQDGTSEYSLPFETSMCLSISLFTSTSWGIL